ncbi:PREDICTED: uncharacterized protein LOC106750277 [Dinoponera quadriceps]|uniref:Uncharacterized protein LOC106750277 n=1 Tax=Dinoponera quadriceps TaxID=609295 RepID=A0A6P3Y531_DINQU|nr:PREDICTED: uncharacterized protein LOC106750277 [Dinoponera quadriceps]
MTTAAAAWWARKHAGIQDRSGIDVSRLSERIRLVLRRFLGFLVRRHPARLAAAYISQNQIGCKVHSPDSPSAGKEVGRNTSSTMQALIPVFAILSVAAAAPLTLLPYAYLADPLPVYQQSQDTRNGVHAYSYAGGPSAKEEVRGLDGVTRGSYSYVDAHGILQSVFYVADESGFRVAATNLPTDGDLPTETGEVLLAKNAHLEEHARAAQEAAKEERSSRRKRSAEAPSPADRDNLPTEEKPRSQEEDQAGQPAKPATSQELPAKSARKAETIVAPVYGLLEPALIPRLSAVAATSQQSQSRVDVHSDDIRLKAVQPTVGLLTEPVYETVILPGQAPLASSHQSWFQVHSALLRAEAPAEKAAEGPETTARPMTAASSQVSSSPPAVKYQLETLPLVATLSGYNENRIQLHKNLGLEGADRKDAVKIDAAPLTIVGTTVAAIPVVAREALPLVTAVSSQSRTQIHRNAKLELALPLVSEPTHLYLATPYVRAFANWPILAAPIAQSSHQRDQIHLNEKIEVTK